MDEEILKKYKPIFIGILLAAVILMIIGLFSGCRGHFEVVSENVIDYRYTESRTQSYSRVSDKGYPYYEYYFVPEKFELMWEYTYQDGHKRRTWKECTRVEYQKAKEAIK